MVHWVLGMEGQLCGIDGPCMFLKRGACALVHGHKLVSGGARSEHMSI